MRSVLHLVAMPWSNPHMPSPQLAALKAYIDGAVDPSIRSYSYSAFVDIALEERHGRLRNLYDEYGAHGDYLFFLICFRRFLSESGPTRRISLGKLISSINRSIEPDGKPITKTILTTLENRTRRFVHETLSRGLRRNALNIIGFTLSYSQLYASIYCIRYLQEKFPEFRCLYLVGGETVTLPKVARALKSFGVTGLAVMGEGEKKLEQIVRMCLAMDLTDSDSAVLELAGSVAGTYPIQSNGVNLYEFDTRNLGDQIDHLEELPPPSFDEYFASLNRSLTIERIRTEFRTDVSLVFEGSRGCWYGRCGFCDIRRSWKGSRSASSKWIVDRVLMLVAKHRCPSVWFMDCTCDQWASEYAKILIDRCIRVGGFMELRAHHPQSFWTALSLAGVEHIQVGIEAVTPRLLATMRKGTTAAQNILVLKWLRELGIQSCSNIITHYPGSTVQDIADTKRILQQISHFDSLDVASFAVLLGSPVDAVLSETTRRELVERHPCTWPKTLQPYLVGNNDFEFPTSMENQSVAAAWDDFIRWKTAWEGQHGDEPTMTQTRLGRRELLVVDERFGERQEHYLEDELALTYEACHFGPSLTALRDSTDLAETRLRADLKRLAKAELVLGVGESYIALAVRPRDELVSSHFRSMCLQ